jgi:hypothetical protein
MNFERGENKMARRTMRVGGIMLEVALGVFLFALLVSALQTPESKATSLKANLTNGVLLPLQGSTPCTLTCPANVTTAAGATCPFSASGVVNYPAPTTTGDCTTVTCTPPSGSSFPVGSSMVTCMTTGGQTSSNPGATVTCGFTVTVFGMCLQDDSNPGNVVLLNPFTGAYQFCCNGTVVASGTGTLSVKGCVVSIQHYPNNYRVNIKADTAVKTGSATIQMPPGVVKCTIGDRNITNNTCTCPAAIVPPPAD